MKCHQYPSNSPDWNPIENIWAHMKYIISKEYAYIASQNVMKEVVVSIWNDFTDHRQDHLVEIMPERIQVVVKARGDPLIFRVRLGRIYFILYLYKISMPRTLWWWSNYRSHGCYLRLISCLLGNFPPITVVWKLIGIAECYISLVNDLIEIFDYGSGYQLTWIKSWTGIQSDW